MSKCIIICGVSMAFRRILQVAQVSISCRSHQKHREGAPGQLYDDTVWLDYDLGK